MVALAKLSIKKREDTKGNNGFSLRDYDVTIDGQEINHLTGIKLDMQIDSFNECALYFYVDHVDVDAEFLTALEAHVKKSEKVPTAEELDKMIKSGDVKMITED